ncbi:MAG: hypothetical protein ACXQTZ_04895 [Candidatus Alkanophagales archaeon]
MGVEKYLGGIGYLLAPVCALAGALAAAPHAPPPLLRSLVLIGFLMAAAAWLLLGVREKDALLTATGIAMILAPMIVVALAFSVVHPLLEPPSPLGVPFVSPEAFLGRLITALLMAAVVIVVATALHIAAHFRAAGKLRVSTFKYAGAAHAAALALAIALAAVIFTTLLTRAQEMLEAMLVGAPPPAPPGIAVAIAMIAAVVQIAAYVLSAVSFLKLS